VTIQVTLVPCLVLAFIPIKRLVKPRLDAPKRKSASVGSTTSTGNTARFVFFADLSASVGTTSVGGLCATSQK